MSLKCHDEDGFDFSQLECHTEAWLFTRGENEYKCLNAQLYSYMGVILMAK